MFDIELTNRCNANCSFCPRDRTPHQGLMSEEVFSSALSRIVEYRAEVAARLGSVSQRVTFCGLGDALVHPRAVQAVAAVSAAGISCQLNTNAGHLDEAKGRALLAAGLQRINLNIGAIGDEYEAIYGLPFQRTLDNDVRFRELAAGRCHILVMLVGDRGERDRLDKVEAFWRQQGLKHFHRPIYINRGGALACGDSGFGDERAQAHAKALLARRGSPRCGVPVLSMFIGYDGHYYLCSSDWEKVSSHGHVFEHRIVDAIRSRLRHVASRGAPCGACTLDPVNRVAAALADDGFEAADMRQTMCNRAGQVSEVPPNSTPCSTPTPKPWRSPAPPSPNACRHRRRSCSGTAARASHLVHSA